MVNGTGTTHNTIGFDRTQVGGVNQIIADFDFRITPNNGRADGIAFALLNTANHGINGSAPLFSEEPNNIGTNGDPIFNSFGLGFDIFGNEPNNNHISLHYNTLRTVETPTFDLANGVWNHARVEIDFVSDGANVTVKLTPNEGSELLVVDNFKIAGMTAYESRVAFSGRTGGEASIQDIDNINVQFNGTAVPEPASWLMLGFCAITAAAYRWKLLARAV